MIIYLTVLSPIIWVYLALLNKDTEVFDKVYPLARVALLECDDKKKQEVYNKYLQTLSNAESIDGIVLNFAKNFNGNVKDINMNNFIDYLKSMTFFNDVAPMMGRSEKSKYLTVTDGSSESVGKQSRKMRK